MATFLLTWELGQGLGHLVNLRPLAEGLRTRGHRVALALQDLSRAKAVFPSEQIEFFQSPLKQWRMADAGPTLSFAHVLRDNGFDDASKLAGLAEAWRSIIRSVQPDVMVLDHSPTALLAARGFTAKRVLLGTGFFCPLDESPLTCLQPWLHADPAALVAEERSVLATMNSVLSSWQLPPLQRVAQLYYPHDEHLLVTFSELDHYGVRPGQRYWGAWQSGFGKAPVWPAGTGKRIYAYLKPFQELPALLELLARSGMPTIVYSGGIAENLQRRFSTPTLRFEHDPLDMQKVGRECDWAILNGNHGTLVALLMAGKPTLHIPIHVEQALLVNALIRMGAGLGASPADPRHIEAQFRQMLVDTQCAAAAQAFAARHADFDADKQIAAMLDRLEELAP
jgi:hypothetical protein